MIDYASGLGKKFMQNNGMERSNEARERLFSEAKAAYFSGDANHAIMMLRRWWNFEVLVSDTQGQPKPEALRSPSYYFGPGGADGPVDSTYPNDPDSPTGVRRKPYPDTGSGQAIAKPRGPL